MSKYQQEWKKVLQQQIEFKDWKIRTSGGDILIRVPQITDMKLLEDRFPGLILSLLPLIEAPKSSLKFYIGQSAQSDFIYTLI